MGQNYTTRKPQVRSPWFHLPGPNCGVTLFLTTTTISPEPKRASLAGLGVQRALRCLGRPGTAASRGAPDLAAEEGSVEETSLPVICALFLGEGSPTKIEVQKKVGTLILLMEDLQKRCICRQCWTRIRILDWEKHFLQ